MRIASIGHAFFAVMLIALGIVGLIKPHFQPIWEPIPQSLPALAYLCAFLSLVCGIGLLWQRTATIAARALLGYLLLWLLLVRLPSVLPSSFILGAWWPVAKIVVPLAAAWVLYVWFATDWDRQRLAFAAGEKGLRVARVLYGLTLIFFGLAHFFYLGMTTPLVPGWLPWHLFWAYFTGSTFIAAGLAVTFNVFAYLAAALSSLQMGLFTALVWIPIVAAGSKDTFQWSETFLSAALTAAGWVVADSYRRAPARSNSPVVTKI
jgi:uncharacterized membrane protein